jgi:hypothetical protein
MTTLGSKLSTLVPLVLRRQNLANFVRTTSGSQMGTAPSDLNFRKENLRMNIVMRSRIHLPITAIILTATLVLTAATQQQLPFNGALQGREIDTPDSATVSADGNVTGIATLVGQFTFTYQLTVNFANRTATGTGHLIAANGDSISTTIAGSFELTSTPGVASITEINTITGGTGRFTGAQGSFTVERLIDLATGVTSGSFHGTITSPGSAK